MGASPEQNFSNRAPCSSSSSLSPFFCPEVGQVELHEGLHQSSGSSAAEVWEGSLYAHVEAAQTTLCLHYHVLPLSPSLEENFQVYAFWEATG